jgi:putative oxidoreductase
MLGRFTAYLYALLRIITGLMFAMHGSQKLLGWPPMPPMKGGGGPLPPLMLVAGGIELVCGLLIAVGLFTDWAAFIASGEMAVAFFMGHASHGSLNPLVNQGELAVVYCFLFLFLAGNRGGMWSVDAAMGRGRGRVT